MTTMRVPGITPSFEQPRAAMWMPFCLLLCFALLSNFLVTTGHDRQRLLEVTVLAAMAIASMARPAGMHAVFGFRNSKPLAAFFVLGLLGSVQAFSPSHALFEVAILFLLYMFALQIAHEIELGGNTLMLRLVQAVAAICVLHSVNFWVGYVTALVLGAPIEVGSFVIGFSNMRFFNHTQTPILPLLILLCCITPRQSRLRWVWWGLTVYWWMALFAVSGRGTMVGMVGGCIVAALLRRRLAATYVRTAAMSAALGLLAYAVFLVAIPVLSGGSAFGAFATMIERTAADPASNRLVLWQRATDLILAHPWLGVGPMHFAHNAGDLHTGAHPHDWIMQIASEWGIPAFLCLCGALIMASRALLRAGRSLAAGDALNQTICSALVAGGATILIDGLVSGLFVMPQSQLAVVFYLGCAIGWCRGRSERSQDDAMPSRLHKAALACLVAGAAACLVVVVWPDLHARYLSQPPGADTSVLDPVVKWPRLWVDGYF